MTRWSHQRRAADYARRQEAKRRSGQAGEAVAIPSRVTWAVGDTVYARWKTSDKPEAAYWYEPMWVDGVGPKRLKIRGYDGEEGHVSRAFLEGHGWGIVYGPWQKLVAAIVTPWEESYVRHRMETDGYRSATLSGEMMARARAEALPVLGLKPDATDAEAKAAYRAIARRYHPDMPGGDAAVFRKATEAYDAVMDPVAPGAGELIREVMRRVQEELDRRAREGG